MTHCGFQTEKEAHLKRNGVKVSKKAARAELTLATRSKV